MERFSTLIITEDLNLKDELWEALRGNELTHVLTAGEARERVAQTEFGSIILDWDTSRDPLQDIKLLSARGTEPPVVVIVGEGAMDSASTAMAAGAFDYILKPFDHTRVVTSSHKASEAGGLLRQVLLLKPRIMGREDSVPELAILKSLAREDVPVLIRGEPGTGVDLVARALHFNGLRRDGPFVSVDCSGLPPHLLESELFGFEKGAVAGGMIRKSGHAELAEGGTLFLQGIGTLSLHSQQRLARAIIDRELELGPDSSVTWNSRLIASSELNIEELIKSRMFREDLQRIVSEVTILLPPLRERKEDIPMLVNLYLEMYRRMHKRGPIVFSETILKRLSENPWPGNLKELQKTIERYVVAGTMPQTPQLPSIEEVTGILPVRDHPKVPPKPNPLKEASRAAEREAILNTLKECGGNKRMAARTLRISYKTLFNKLHQFNITTRKDFE